MDIYEQVIFEISQNIKNYWDRKQIKFDEDVDYKRILLDFFDNRNKRIVTIPRNVILSNELQHKIQTKKFFEDCTLDDAEEIILNFECIKNKFENGEDVNWNLSRKIFNANPKYRDILLNAWNIRHLHLSRQNVSSKRGMKRNRSNVLLFFITYESYVYCIDIKQHPENDKFFCYNFLKVLHNNEWMNLIGFTANKDENYVVGSLEPKITDDITITELYMDYRMNLAFEFEGVMYSKVKGLVSTGDDSENVQQLFAFKRNMERYLLDDDNFIELRDFNINDDNQELITIVVIERNGLKMNYKVVL